jgi:hypothetical protein
MSFSCLINSNASINLVSQSQCKGIDFSKYLKISGVNTYFHIFQFLDLVWFALGFSKNFSILKILSLGVLVSKIQ